MSDSDPVGLLFGGMEKLGPGSNADTLYVLGHLPRQGFRVVVDAGCGTGRQALALAKGLCTLVHAVDSHGPFLSDLVRRRGVQVGHLVRARCMDMRDIPRAFQSIDLLWSEGAAYNIGFRNALATWAPALAPDGFLVVSELSWLKERAPAVVREFFRSGYPDMRSVQDNIAVAEAAGYRLVNTHALPRGARADGYYDILAPRSKALPDHPDLRVGDFVAETVQEIESFNVPRTVTGTCSTCSDAPDPTRYLTGATMAVSAAFWRRWRPHRCAGRHEGIISGARGPDAHVNGAAHRSDDTARHAIACVRSMVPESRRA